MQMTAEEIRRDYRLAKNPEAQVKVLAEINAVTPKIIWRIIDGQSIEEATARRPPKSYYVPKGLVKHWTSEEKARLKEMWREGYLAKEIAAELGRSVDSVLGAAYNYGLHRRHRKRKATSDAGTSDAAKWNHSQ